MVLMFYSIAYWFRKTEGRRKELEMDKGIQTILFPVTDLTKAKKMFTSLLGMEPQNDDVYYVGYRVGDQDIGLVPNGHQQGMLGTVAYVLVTDINKSLQSLLAAGSQTLQPVRDVGYGKMVAIVKDPDGNMIGLMQLP
jgi:predicted enzyme related to lactoylglutathione lyase